MAEIVFYADENFAIDNLSGSGLGFFSSDGFGGSVLVGSFNGRTFITDGNGVTQGAEVDNLQFLNVGSGIVGQAGSGIHVLAVPNYLATLRMNFNHASAINVTNAEMRIYDRYDINNLASGVTVRMVELIHPTITQIADGSGDNTWIGTTANPQSGTNTVGGSGTTVPLANSPGESGLHAGNGSDSTWVDTQHDWYVGISASPDSVGSKTKFGLYASLEYN